VAVDQVFEREDSVIRQAHVTVAVVLARPLAQTFCHNLTPQHPRFPPLQRTRLLQRYIYQRYIEFRDWLSAAQLQLYFLYTEKSLSWPHIFSPSKQVAPRFRQARALLSGQSFRQVNPIQ
jgi:hypothetical protein